MTIDEAIRYYENKNVVLTEEEALANTIAIETMRKYQKIEQEPILDKIRAEIKALSNANPSYWHSGDMVDRDDVLEIIDKYKAESEDQDGQTNN